MYCTCTVSMNFKFHTLDIKLAKTIISLMSNKEVEGSWLPSLTLALLIFLRWVIYGDSAVGIRRWYNMQVCGNLHPSEFCVRCGS